MKQEEVIRLVPKKKWAAIHEIYRDDPHAVDATLRALVAKGAVIRRKVRRLTSKKATRVMWEYRRA